METTGDELAVVAWREEGRWEVSVLPIRIDDDLDTFVATLRQQPGEDGAIGFVSVDDDFFLAVRVGGGTVRFLLSDVTAAMEWPLARAVTDALGIESVTDADDAQPVGDLTLFADLGLEPRELATLCADLELYPDEVIEGIGARLGFVEQYDRAVAAAR
jgi:putative tRNA adenosine deaminase-associated protein